MVRGRVAKIWETWRRFEIVQNNLTRHKYWGYWADFQTYLKWGISLRNHQIMWISKATEKLIPLLNRVQYIYIYTEFSRSVVSDSLWPHGLQYTRPPCPSPTPGLHPNPCPLSQWCHPTILSSVIPFFSCPQSFPESASFQMSQLFTSGDQSIGVSALASVLSMNIQDWFPLGWTSWISLQPKGLSRVFSNTTVQKHQFFCTQLSL